MNSKETNKAKPELIVIGGPSASGKSQLAIDLCLKLQEIGQKAEIISADSIAVFRKFDIGCAKPDAAQLAQVKHHLIDICDASEEFNAADFVAHAEPIIKQMQEDNTLPVIVGGTGFYLRALLHGMANAPSDPQIKARLYKEAEESGIAEKYKTMMQLDPALRKTIHPNDNYRILRALEVMEITNRKWSELNDEVKNQKPKYQRTHCFCIKVPREELKLRVQKRTQVMIASGLVQEVEQLLESGLSPETKALQSVGYKECLEYLGKIKIHEKEPIDSLDQLEARIVQKTMHLAKNQMTWFRSQMDTIWLEDKALEKILSSLQAALW